MEYNFEALENGIIKISIKGRLVAAFSKQFENAATNYLGKSKYVLINLKEMEHIDSYGLMTLVKILQLIVVKNGGVINNFANDASC